MKLAIDFASWFLWRVISSVFGLFEDRAAQNWWYLLIVFCIMAVFFGLLKIYLAAACIVGVVVLHLVSRYIEDNYDAETGKRYDEVEE
jgi:hypothetical protein